MAETMPTSPLDQLPDRKAIEDRLSQLGQEERQLRQLLRLIDLRQQARQSIRPPEATHEERTPQ